MNPPARVDVIGSQISICNDASASKAIEMRLREGSGGYVCFTNAHTAVTGRRDSSFQSITNSSFLSVADGTPVFWVGRAKAGKALGHVPGPDFFITAMRHFAAEGHFFYGSTPEVLQSLVASLQKSIPGLRVSGVFSPPFRPLSKEDKDEHYEMIRKSGAKFVWVGLGAPKQEQWMSESWQALRPCILFGVGAAFDFHAGTVIRAPKELRSLGLEWLHRLIQEPRRLSKRYFVTNSLFLWYAAADWLSGKSRQ